MKRRQFLTLVGGAVVCPLAARAQQPERVRRVGVLIAGAERDPVYVPLMRAFRDQLQELGWEEGRNIRFDFRWTDADPARNQSYAAELVSLAPDLMFAQSTPPVRALQHASSKIPIVFVAVSDPVGDGFVASVARPGGNITGFTSFDPDMIGKWLDLLKEVAPNTKSVAVIYNPDTAPHSIFLPALRVTTQSFGMRMTLALVRSDAEIESAIAAVAHETAHGLLAMPDSFTYVRRALITAQVAKHHLPAVYPFPAFATSGGLVAYGVDITDQYRQAASYIDQILKGTNPADLPVQQPTKFELDINLKTAKALGLTIPPALLASATEVIE